MRVKRQSLFPWRLQFFTDWDGSLVLVQVINRTEGSASSPSVWHKPDQQVLKYEETQAAPLSSWVICGVQDFIPVSCFNKLCSLSSLVTVSPAPWFSLVVFSLVQYLGFTLSIILHHHWTTHPSAHTATALTDIHTSTVFLLHSVC